LRVFRDQVAAGGSERQAAAAAMEKLRDELAKQLKENLNAEQFKKIEGVLLGRPGGGRE
jgi:hypothetical protein